MSADDAARFCDGFSECRQEVLRFLSNSGAPQDLASHVLNHLDRCQALVMEQQRQRQLWQQQVQQHQQQLSQQLQHLLQQRGSVGMLVAPAAHAAQALSHAALLGHPAQLPGSILPPAMAANPQAVAALSDPAVMSERSPPPLVSPASDSASRHAAALSSVPTAFQTPTLVKDGDVTSSARGGPAADPLRVTMQPGSFRPSSATFALGVPPASAFSGSPSVAASAALNFPSAFSDGSGGCSSPRPDSSSGGFVHRSQFGPSLNCSVRGSAGGLSVMLSDMALAALGRSGPSTTRSPAASPTTSDSDSFASSRGSTPDVGAPTTTSSWSLWSPQSGASPGSTASRGDSWPPSHSLPAARELFSRSNDVTHDDVVPNGKDVAQKDAVPVPGGNDVAQADAVPDGNDDAHDDVVPDQIDVAQKDVSPEQHDLAHNGFHASEQNDVAKKDVVPGQNDVAKKDVAPGQNDVAKMEVVSEQNGVPRDFAPDQTGGPLQDVVSRRQAHLGGGNDVDMVNDHDVWRPW